MKCFCENNECDNYFENIKKAFQTFLNNQNLIPVLNTLQNLKRILKYSVNTWFKFINYDYNYNKYLYDEILEGYSKAYNVNLKEQ